MKKLIFLFLFFVKSSLAINPQSFTSVAKLPLFILADQYALKDNTKQALIFENLYLFTDFVDTLIKISTEKSSILENIFIYYDLIKIIQNIQILIENKNLKNKTQNNKENKDKKNINLKKQKFYTTIKYLLAITDSVNSLEFSLNNSNDLKKIISRLSVFLKLLNLNIDNKNTKINNKFIAGTALAGSLVVLAQIIEQIKFKIEENARKKAELERNKLKREKQEKEELEKHERINTVGEIIVQINDEINQDGELKDIPEDESLENLKKIIVGEKDRCPICFEDFAPNKNMFIRNGCHHAFCLDCAIKNNNKLDDYARRIPDNCPLCRKEFDGGKAFAPKA